MKEKNFKFKIFSIILIPLFSIAAFLPTLFSYNYQVSRESFFTTYDNALDNSLALGVAPDYDTTSYAGKIKYAEYLEPFNFNNNITQYKNISIMDGKEVNRIPIEKLKVNSIVLNEWMKVDSYKFKGIVNNIIYTSMGDSNEACYVEEMNVGGWNYNTQVSIDKAFLMQANDMDKNYPNNNFLEKAKKIIEMDKIRIKNLNYKYRDIFKNISIGIIRGSNEAVAIDTDFYFISPRVYPFFYENGENKNDLEKGLGFQFPTPRNNAFLNEGNYKYDRIEASNTSLLINQFENKFDYIFYLGSDNNNYSKEDVINSRIKNFLKNPKLANENIEFSKLGKWYTSAWGIIGKRELISYLIKFINKDFPEIIDDDKLIWSVPKEFKKIRKGNL